jgi:hypothetical protein
MTTVGRTFLSIVAACAVSAALAGPAAATLVPGELRFGPTTADPLVPLFDAASPLQTSLGLRELPGGAPKIEFTSTSPNPPALSCDPLPADEVYSAAELTTNGPVAGQQLYVTADDCQSAFVSGRIELNVYRDPLRSFAMRAEANRTGGRDGVLEPQPGQPFRVKLDFFNPGQTQPYGGFVQHLLAGEAHEDRRLQPPPRTQDRLRARTAHLPEREFDLQQRDAPLQRGGPPARL